MSRTKDLVREDLGKHNQPAQHVEQKANTSVLETSGILDAYEYFLRQLCKNGLPSGNVYEFAAQQILKFERKRNAEIKKRVALKNSLEALENQQNQQDQQRENKANKSPEKKKQESVANRKSQESVPQQSQQFDEKNNNTKQEPTKAAQQPEKEKKGQETKQEVSKKDQTKKK